MRRYALFLSGILLTASCGTVRNLGSYGLEDNPNVFCTLRIAGYFTVTHFDDKNVSWRGASYFAQIGGYGLPDEKQYAEVRIRPGLHRLQVDLQRGNQRSTRPLNIAYDFRAGRTYLLSMKMTIVGEGWSETATVKPRITAVDDDTSSNVETVPRKGTGYTVTGGP